MQEFIALYSGLPAIETIEFLENRHYCLDENSRFAEYVNEKNLPEQYRASPKSRPRCNAELHEQVSSERKWSVSMLYMKPQWCSSQWGSSQWGSIELIIRPGFLLSHILWHAEITIG